MCEQKYRVDCWNCGGEGVIEGECTCWDDCCCCLEPEAPTCSHCGGVGFLVVTELSEDAMDRNPVPLNEAHG